MKKALFIDRDGVINKEYSYVYRIEDFEFIDGIFDALKKMQQNGYLLIIITNQAGIAKGLYKEDDFYKLTSWMIDAFKNNGVNIDRVYHCPHKDGDGCECRKPKAGMVNRAKKEFDIDIDSSWLIGDKESDIEAGINSGIKNTILVRSGHKIDEKNTKASFVCDSIKEAVKLIV